MSISKVTRDQDWGVYWVIQRHRPLLGLLFTQVTDHCLKSNCENKGSKSQVRKIQAGGKEWRPCLLKALDGKGRAEERWQHGEGREGRSSSASESPGQDGIVFKKKTDWVFKSGSHTFLRKTEDRIRDPSGDVDLKYITKPGKRLEIHASLRKSNFRKLQVGSSFGSMASVPFVYTGRLPDGKMDMGRKKAVVKQKWNPWNVKWWEKDTQPLGTRRSLILVLNWDTP